MASIAFDIVLPLLLTAGVFFLRPARVWLERRASDAAMQRHLTERYQDAAATFLRHSDPELHADMRLSVLYAGVRMLDGSRLARDIIFAGDRVPSDDDAKLDIHIDALSKDALQAFGAAVASAMLVSSYQSWFYGDNLRAALGNWILSISLRDVREPEQIVVRYHQVRELRPAKIMEPA